MRTDQDLRYGLSVVLPTLNEADNLAELVPRIYLEIGHLVSDLEVIIVDDSSTDATLAVVLNLQYRFPSLKIIDRRGSPRSLPNSIRDGVMNSRNAYVCWMDADGSMQPSVIKDMIHVSTNSLRGESSLVIASRFVKGGGIKGQSSTSRTSVWQLIRNLRTSEDHLLAVSLSWTLNKVIRLATKKYCRDSTSGFILVPKKLLQNYSFHGVYGDYFPRLMDYFRSKNIQVIEIPYVIQIRKHGVSKTGDSALKILRSGLPYIKYLWEVILKN